jgi:carbon-monoxide dehydrogenase catalytic subunit
MGSCVDNTRIVSLAAAPEWYSEKAAAIAGYAVARGVYTALGVNPPGAGSAAVTDLFLNGLKAHLGTTFAVKPDPHRAAALLIGHIGAQRRRLGLEARSQTGEK